MTLGRTQITPQLVEAVRDSADVLAIASEHTQLKKAGHRLQGLCPLHKEKTPSFSVDPVQGLYYCFGCGAGGDAIKLHMQLTGDDFPAAIESLARQHGIPLPSSAPRRGRGGGPEHDTEAVLEAAQRYFLAQLESSDAPRAYLEKRRIPPQLIERFGLGYAPQGWRNLLETLHPKLPLADLEAGGLILTPQEGGGRPYDRFRNRLMFPIHSPSGRLLGFGGRTLGDDRAKYLNTNETERFQKGHLLYGLHLARRSIRESGKALLVEGYFDVLAAVACGIDWVVASMGTALRPQQASLIARYADELVVGYDGDHAGEEAARRAIPILLTQGLGVRRARFPIGQDPDSVRLEDGEKAFLKIIEAAPDAMLLELDRVVPANVREDPHLQARTVEQVRELLAPIRNPILRSSYSRLATDRLGLKGDVLWKGSRRERENLVLPRRDAGESRSPGRGLEEKTLQLLFEPHIELPSPGDMLPPEVFLDPVCRNIYASFCDLYRGEGGRPAVRSVLGHLPSAGEAVDRVARVLLQEPSHPEAGDLQASFDLLRRRWHKQRQRQLAQQINRAQQAGEGELLERLLKEKMDLSRNLHRSQ